MTAPTESDEIPTLLNAISRMSAASCLNDTDLGKFVYATCNELVAPLEALAATPALPVPGGTILTWQPMETAPKDGTMLRMLVEFTDNATEDSPEPCATIGVNNFAHDGIDNWQFAGWNWQQDCFTEGIGVPVGWLPMVDAAARAAPTTVDRNAVLEECAALAVQWGNARVDDGGGNALRNYAEAVRALKSTVPASTPQLAVQGAMEALATITLGGIEGDELGDIDIEIIGRKRLEAIQYRMVRTEYPIYLHLYGNVPAEQSTDKPAEEK